MSSGDVAEREIELDGRRVRVLDHGEGPVAAVLLHGGLAGHAPWPGSADLWRPLLDRLRVPRVVALDLPGAGGSPVEDVDELTIAGLTERVVATLSALGITTAVPVGHAEASLVALLLARQQHDGLTVPAAALIAASGAAPTSDGVPPVVLTQPPIGQGAAAQARWALDRLSWSAAHITEDLVARLAAHADGPGRRSAAAVLAAPTAVRRLDADLLASKMELFAFARDTGYDRPLAIVWAADDPLLTVEHGDALFALLSTTRAHLSFTLVPRAGHLVYREEPAAVARVLGPFVRRATTVALAGAAR
jgi:2-hydroxy-6-oxonona-2,4-dienedioate hydrolase